MLEYRVAYGTYLGGRVKQEDCLLLNGEIVQEEGAGVRSRTVAGEALLFAVCDGMGGHAAGEVASRFACEQLRGALTELPVAPEQLADLLRRIQVLMERQLPRNCGTTVAGVVLAGTRVLAFNAGDSRVYRISRSGIDRFSHDHSLVQTYVDRGELSPAGAVRHRHRHVIEFGLGEVFAAEWAAGERGVHFRQGELLPGEVCLLCSDGVHDVLEDAEIASLFHGAGPQDHAAALEAAVRGRMTDNTSFIVIAAAS